ncbi:hypothetical protein GW813_05835, partial [bacterium]|nr:hypothetical protein [bacterium]
ALLENARGRARERRGWFGLRRGAPPSLTVHIVVESNAVRHRMSLLLKRRIEEAIAARSGANESSPITIDWQAGLTE